MHQKTKQNKTKKTQAMHIYQFNAHFKQVNIQTMLKSMLLYKDGKFKLRILSS